MLLVVAGLKGGTGKTTVATTLAAATHRRGARTLLVDAAPGGDAHYWAQTAPGVAPPTCALAPSSPEWPELLVRLAAGHAWTIVDAPSTDVRTTRWALEVADFVIAPCAASPLDAWSLTDVFTLIGVARTKNPRLGAAVLLNGHDPRTRLGAGLRDDLIAAGAPVLRSTLPRRIAYPEAMALGSAAIFEDEIVHAEVEALIDELGSLRVSAQTAARIPH
jgi:chromosome partitioning protein